MKGQTLFYALHIILVYFFQSGCWCVWCFLRDSVLCYLWWRGTPYCLFPGPHPFLSSFSVSLSHPHCGSLYPEFPTLCIRSHSPPLSFCHVILHTLQAHTHTQPVLRFLCSFMYVCVNISLSFCCWETGSSTNICSIIWGTAAVIEQSSCRYSASPEFSGANIKYTVVTRQISQSWSQYFGHVLVIRLDAVFFLLPAHTNHHTSATFR